MGTTIDVKDSTWAELNSLKSPGDSFDDVINELLQDGGGDVKSQIKQVRDQAEEAEAGGGS